MRKQLCFAVTAFALATVALPARAQSFLTGSVRDDRCPAT